ncbi:MAG: haloalkane dehalogenase [Candidatus Thorarchaeota archaeon]|jgi:haloalkane dehalogenase
MPKVKVLRTPDSQFENLPEYDFIPNYTEFEGIRIHYVDEGPKDAPPVLLMHGEPSWSYLYRKMIPPIVSAGYRVIAPDLIGFGKSDKYTRTKDYSYQMHVNSMLAFVRDLDLADITLFCQDWGGLIGLRVLGEYPDRFARVVAGNTMLPAARGLKGRIGYTVFKIQVRREGKVTAEELQKNTTFTRWVAYSRTVDIMDIGGILQSATVSTLSPEVIKAYNAPFPNEYYKAGARIFPSLVPSQLRENQRVWDKVLTKWEKPFLTAFSDKDPITRGGDAYFLKKIPGTEGQEHVTIKDAGHFLQEDKSEELAQVILNFISDTN